MDETLKEMARVVGLVEEEGWQALPQVGTPGNLEWIFSVEYCWASDLTSFQAGDKRLGLNIALSSNLGWDSNSLL